MLSITLVLSFVAGGLAQYLRSRSKNKQLRNNNSIDGNPFVVSSVLAIKTIEPCQTLDLNRSVDQTEIEKIRKWWLFAQEETMRRAYLAAKRSKHSSVKANLELAESFIYLKMPLEYRMESYAFHCFCAYFAISNDSSKLTDDQKSILEYTEYRVNLLREYYKRAYVTYWQEEEAHTYSVYASGNIAQKRKPG